MDAQIVHRLQAEEKVEEQCQSFQTDRQASQLAQAPTDNLDNTHHQVRLDQLDI